MDQPGKKQVGVFDDLHYTFKGITPPNDHEFNESSVQKIFGANPLIHLFSYSVLDSGLLNQNLFFVTKEGTELSAYTPLGTEEAQELITIPINQIRSNTRDIKNMTGLTILGTRTKTGEYVIGILLPQTSFKPGVCFNPFYPTSFDLLPATSFEVSNGISFLRHMCRTRFCSFCGIPTDVDPVGRHVTCAACKKDYYVKCDLAAIGIVLSADKTRCVLARRRDLWALISGFNECGESPMDCMVRECKEEIGIDLQKDNEHVASLMDEGGFSYWATSGSYMFGFRCICKDGEELKSINFDKNEIPDAAWYTREEVLDTMTREMSGKPVPFKVPGRHTLARRIIEHWVFDGHESDWEEYQQLIQTH